MFGSWTAGGHTEQVNMLNEREAQPENGLDNTRVIGNSGAVAYTVCFSTEECSRSLPCYSCDLGISHLYSTFASPFYYLIDATSINPTV